MTACLVSPDSTGQLFSSPVACLALRISAIVRWMPCKALMHIGDMFKFARWLQKVQKITLLSHHCNNFAVF